MKRFIEHVIRCCLLVAFIGTSLLGCDRAPPTTAGNGAYIEKGDLNAINERGQLRILVRRFDDRFLPRNGCPLALQRTLLAEYARQMDLQPRLVYVDRFKDFIPALLSGKGDVIAANFTITASREAQVAFTIPLFTITEQLFSSASNAPFSSLEEIAGRRLAVQQGTSFFETAQRLRAHYPDLQLELLPPEWTREQILDKVGEGKIDIALQDSNFMAAALPGRNDLNVLWTLEDKRHIAWGIRPDNPRLCGALNRFLYMQNLSDTADSRFTSDLDDIKQRKALRLITRNNASTYFLWRGELLGFEYELATRFAQAHNIRLEVVVAPTHNDMIPMLQMGEGDIAAGFLAQTPERLAQHVDFSRPYHYASELLVCRADEMAPTSLEDLNSRTVTVRRTSSYWHTLSALKKKHNLSFTLATAPETMETEDILSAVADGTYDLTVADSHILDLELTWRNDIVSAFPLGDPIAHSWVVRSANSNLLHAINQFFEEEYRGLFYNMTYNKYFKSPRAARETMHSTLNTKRTGRISPYDQLVKEYADMFHFDWRLITAQMYQESQFDPSAVSWSGATGLMQLMPTTARELGFRDVVIPDNGIHAGVKYLNWLYEHLRNSVPPEEQVFFALAAYNAGLGHVEDAQRLARQKGWDDKRWFDNVENAMLLLSRSEYARNARYGYCRGSEPVTYVREIQKRYEGYKQLAH